VFKGKSKVIPKERTREVVVTIPSTGSSTETTGQNPLEQKFEWKLNRKPLYYKLALST
jgi:hypothetical protein